MIDKEVLQHRYDKYYEAGTRAYKAGNLKLAKQNLVLAAAAKMQLAEYSTPQLKNAQIQSAKNILSTVILIDETLEKQLEDEKAKQMAEEEFPPPPPPDDPPEAEQYYTDELLDDYCDNAYEEIRKRLKE